MWEEKVRKRVRTAPPSCRAQEDQAIGSEVAGVMSVGASKQLGIQLHPDCDFRPCSRSLTLLLKTTCSHQYADSDGERH